MGRRKQVAPRSLRSTEKELSNNFQIEHTEHHRGASNLEESSVETYHVEIDAIKTKSNGTTLNDNYSICKVKENNDIECPPKGLKCHHCGKYFKHKKSLQRHTKLHSGIRKHKCSICGTAFVRSDHLRSHIKTHSTKRKRSNDETMPPVSLCFDIMECDKICTKTLSSIASTPPLNAQTEALDMINDTPCDLSKKSGQSSQLAVICPVCDVTLSNMATFVIHMATDHAKYQNNNNTTTTNNNSKKNNENTQSGSDLAHKKTLASLTCVFCGSCSATQDDALRHLSCHYSRLQTKFVCTECGKSFMNETTLIAHCVAMHSTRIVRCKLCSDLLEVGLAGSETEEQEIIRHHYVTNHCQLQHVTHCDLCSEASFLHPSDAYAHIFNKHLCHMTDGAKAASMSIVTTAQVKIEEEVVSKDDSSSHLCTVCQVNFKNEATLLRHQFQEHEQAYTSEADCKMFQRTLKLTCSYCGKHQRNTTELEKHLRSHYSSTRLHCNICDEEFSNSSVLEEHKLIHHHRNAIPPVEANSNLSFTSVVNCVSCQRPFNNVDCDTKQCSLCRINTFQAILCPLCMQTFETIYQLRMHLLSHKSASVCQPSPTPHQAVQSQVKLRESSTCSSALTNCTPNAEGKFMCPVCDQDFSIETELLKHRKLHLAALTSRQSQQQQQQLPFATHHRPLSQTAKRAHTKPNYTHTAESALHQRVRRRNAELSWRFKCDRCTKRFLTWKDKAVHRMLHHKRDGKQSCKLCNKSFSRRESEILHMLRKHSP